MVNKSLKKKMVKRKAELERKGTGSGQFFLKGTTRMRIRSAGEENEFGIEVIQFFLGTEKGSFISPATFGEKCAFMEKYQELKSSKDDYDLSLAKSMSPKVKYMVCADIYADEKGKDWDDENQEKLVPLPKGVYQELVDYWLDEDEWGDMTDPKDGYDIKITKSGTGLQGTTYSVNPCQKKKISGPQTKSVDLEKKVKALVLTYEETVEKLNNFLGAQESSSDEDEAPKKKKKKSVLKKKKKYRGDI